MAGLLQILHTILDLVAGDDIELYIFQNSGADVLTAANTDKLVCYLTATEIL